MSTSTQATTQWVIAIPSGVGGSIRTLKGNIHYIISANPPTAPIGWGDQIRYNDTLHWGPDASRGAVWVAKSTEEQDVDYFVNLYTDDQAGA